MTTATRATYLTRKGKKLTPNVSPVPGIDRPWVVVTSAGTDDEYEFGDCGTFGEAMRLQQLAGEGADIMKRRADGSLSTEY